MKVPVSVQYRTTKFTVSGEVIQSTSISFLLNVFNIRGLRCIVFNVQQWDEEGGGGGGVGRLVEAWRLLTSLALRTGAYVIIWGERLFE